MPKSSSPKTGRKRGAPAGNRNAFKHGRYTRERRALYAAVRAHIEHGRALTAALDASDPCAFRKPDCRHLPINAYNASPCGHEGAIS